MIDQDIYKGLEPRTPKTGSFSDLDKIVYKSG